MITKSDTMKEKTIFNKISSVHERKIVDNFNGIEELVNYIKSENRPEVPLIKKARKIGKGTDKYSAMKKQSPCVIINFNHDKEVNGSTIIKPTGYMYIDIDNRDFFPDDITHVAAYWKSISNIGYSLVLKVKGLNQDYLKEQYKCVCKHLNLPYDDAAVSKDRLTFLSYDPDAFYNERVEELDINTLFNIPTSSKNQIESFTNSIKPNKKSAHFDNLNNPIHPNYSTRNEQSDLKFDNLQEVLNELGIVPVFNELGVFDIGYNVEYVKLGIYESIPKGKRHKTLSSYISNFIAINPGISYKHFLNLLGKINRENCKPPLSHNDIEDIVKYAFSNKDKFKPHKNKKTRFLFNTNIEIDKKEKAKYINTVLGKKRSENTYNKIKEIIKNWNIKKEGKITKIAVAKKSGVSRNSVTKYWNDIQNEITINIKL